MSVHKHEDSEKLLYNMKELRIALGSISRDKIYKLFAAGDLTKLKIGTNTYVRVEDVKAYVSNLGN